MKSCLLFSGGVNGAEAAFGDQAEAFGVEEVNFTFDGHKTKRKRGVRFLTSEELLSGGLACVSKLMNRGPLFRKVLQSIWRQINHAEEVLAVGKILDDATVKGGTGWGAEFAKICNKPLHAFDQEKNRWFKWETDRWKEKNSVKIRKKHFAGTGARFLNENGGKAIRTLFANSFE